MDISAVGRQTNYHKNSRNIFYDVSRGAKNPLF